MALPRIEVHLDPGPWRESEYADYRVCGETISGHVRIGCDEPITCRAVHVSLGWHTEGRGDRDEQTVYEQQLYEGEIPTGGLELPFSAELPEAPISYAGHYINILWSVKARIDLAWKRDPTAEQRIHAILP